MLIATYNKDVIDIPMIFIEDDYAIRIGMSRYRYIPRHGIILVLGNRDYRYITMKDVLFPIDVQFRDKSGRIIGNEWTRLYVGNRDIPIPIDTYYVIEIPINIL